MNDENKNYNFEWRKKEKNTKRKYITYTVILLIITNIITALLVNAISFRLPNGKVLVSRKTFENILAFEKLYTVKDKIDKYYLGEVDDKALVEGAAKGMAEALNDPYTTFKDEKEFKDFTTEIEGSYVGIGIQVGVKENKIVVISTFNNSPAKEAGILPGDTIEVVNGTVVTGKDLEKATSMIKGKEGEEVKLVVSRENKGKMNFDITRREIQLETVRHEILQDNIGYIQVSMFDENTSENFSKALADLAKNDMKSLIVDLRGNPGGLLGQTVEMASQFIPKDKNIVYTEDKYGNRKHYNSIGGNYIGLPVTVLIDRGSASASEIFIGALQDYGYATLVGEKSFGKGVVQTTFYTRRDGFGDGTALKVTISKYFTPNGKNIHGVGIKPDVEVKYPDELREKPYDRNSDPQLAKALEIAKDKIE
ncbi:S41 family peptidase [Clostridium butanoliproducens]|uniref:S41 family peptidase n=1 Tax=Clostridium butanoliproducens TaxID=2991837 RepID=UPI0024B973C0|nr:S41 family peptidase [Clostridium butanoliproducens]